MGCRLAVVVRDISSPWPGQAITETESGLRATGQPLDQHVAAIDLDGRAVHAAQAVVESVLNGRRPAQADAPRLADFERRVDDKNRVDAGDFDVERQFASGYQQEQRKQKESAHHQNEKR